MDKLTSIKTETFDTGFRIDIVTNDTCYEGFIYHKNYGVKSLMLVITKKDHSYKEAQEIFERSIPDYIVEYFNSYMD